MRPEQKPPDNNVPGISQVAEEVASMRPEQKAPDNSVAPPSCADGSELQ